MAGLTSLARLLTLGALALTAASAAVAQPDLDPAIPDRLSQRIVADLARADLDGFAVNAATYLAAKDTERLKNSFSSIN